MTFKKLKITSGMLYYRKYDGYCDIFIIGKIPTIGFWNLTIEDNGITEKELSHIQDKEKYSTYGISGDDWEEIFELVNGTSEDLNYIMSIPDLV